jgi:ATP-dependent Zn protease
MRTAVLLLAICFGVRASALGRETTEHLNYDEFVRSVEAGQIKEVKLDRFSSISGIKMGNGKEWPFTSYADLGTANDPLLLRFLKEHKVAVTVSSEKERPGPFSDGCAGLMMGAGFLLLPILTVANFILLVILHRQVKQLQKSKQTGAASS